jgi:[NiFe] hydrogenase diaphorase moiety large subunit
MICFDDLATGGSLVVFNSDRNVVEIARDFVSFFVHESCGYCTPCRVGNVLLKERLDRILDGKGEPADLDYLHSLCTTIKTASRCGLGQTSSNPVMSTLTNFRDVYEGLVKPREGALQRSFDMRAAVQDAAGIAGRDSVLMKAEGV